MKGKMTKSMTIIIQKIEAKSITRKEKKEKKQQSKIGLFVRFQPVSKPSRSLVSLVLTIPG